MDWTPLKFLKCNCGYLTPLKYLYRYYRQNSPEIEQILVHNKLLFSDPSVFNDPFDCATTINFDNASEEELIEYCNHLVEYRYKKDGVYPTSEQIKKETEDCVSKGKHRDKKFLEECSHEIQNSVKEVREEFKILCLTEDPKNVPMWAHYAENHKGVVFQFDKSRLLDEHGEDKCFPVDYKTDFPSLKEYLDCLNDNHPLKFPKLFYCRKHIAWKYEQEWRMFRTNPNDGQGLDIPDGMLTGIILGCKNEKKDLIIDLNSQRERPVTIYHAEQSKKSFELVITSESGEQL
jgi:hypothetical protein